MRWTMKLFFALGLSLFAVCAVAEPEEQIAIQVSQKFQQGILSKEEAHEILLATFDDYSHPEGKLAALTQFITKTIGIENPLIHTAPEQRGWSGSEVLSVRYGQETPFFLKIFPYDSKYYLPEIFGLNLMKGVEGIGFPKICGLGHYEMDGNRYFLLLETAVGGSSIQHFLSQVGQYEIGSKKREAVFLELCEAVHVCGSGLAKFHQHLCAKKQPFPEAVKERVRQDLQAAMDELIAHPREGIESEHLQLYTEEVLQKMQGEEHFIGLVYDDIKTIHTFYDPLKQKISFVNPHHIYLSFSREGQLQGVVAQDVCKYLLSLQLNRVLYFLDETQKVSRKELMTQEEMFVVKNVFETSYCESGGVLPSEVEREYALLQHNLFFIKNSHRLRLPEPEQTRVQDLVELSLEDLRARLVK